MSRERNIYQIAIHNEKGTDAIVKKVVYHSDSPMPVSAVIDRLNSQSRRERIKGRIKNFSYSCCDWFISKRKS